MRWGLSISILALVLAVSTAAGAEQRVHVVASGQTLGRIAKRYNVSIDALCTANRIKRTDPIRPGQKLVVPGDSDPDGKKARAGRPSRDDGGKDTKDEKPPGKPTHHVVQKGQTLGKIAARYHTSVTALCTANGISKNDALQIGQELVIPHPRDEDGTRARAWAKAKARREPKAAERNRSRQRDDDRGSDAGMKRLEVAGTTVYFYEPIGRGRLTMRPVLLYLHGRGGHAAADCRRWAAVARRQGWLACPMGPEDRGAGRGWANNWASGRRIAMATIDALRKEYGRRVQLYGNTIIGFSEGAYVAMNVGVREARTFNRWLILAAHSRYWGGMGLEELAKQRGRIRRVYLITGGQDEVLEGTEQVKKWLRHYGVPVQTSTPDDMGHEVALGTKAAMYRAALVWLQTG